MRKKYWAVKYGHVTRISHADSERQAAIDAFGLFQKRQNGRDATSKESTIHDS